MAGTVIADYIQAAGSTLSMNVGNTLVLTANASGLTYVPTGNVNINIGSTASLTLGTLVVSNTANFSNTTTHTGAATFANTLGVTGATTLSSTLAAGNTTITGALSTTSTAVIGSGVNGQLQINNAGGNNGASLWFSGASVASGNRNWLINYGDFAANTLVFAIATAAGGVINSSATEVLRLTSLGLAIQGTGSFNGALSTTTTLSAGTSSGFQTLQSGRIQSTGTYNVTTANPANVQIDGNAEMCRVTSALKYKQDIRDLELIDVNKFRPVRYKSKCLNDDQTVDHFGIIADEVDAAGITELVSYGNDGEIESFAYERLTVVLLKAIQDLTARLAVLEAK